MKKKVATSRHKLLLNQNAALLQQLQTLYQQLDKKMQREWQRSLPLEELLSDRWRRANELGFDNEASIYASAIVFGKVKVGKKTWIGPNTILDGSGGRITIGEYCNISAGSQIYTHDSIAWCLSGGKTAAKKGAVTIGKCTYIGPQVVIQRGVKIGHHCVIGALSMVNRDIPPYSFAVGSPCRVIGVVKQDKYGR